MRLTANGFKDLVLKGVRPENEPFTPTATYDPDGDCIEFLFSPESFYGERVDDLITVFYSNATGEIVGSLVKGVKGYIRKHLNAIIMIENNRIKMSYLLMTKAFTSSEKLETVALRKYQKLIKIAEEKNIAAEIPNLEECCA